MTSIDQRNARAIPDTVPYLFEEALRAYGRRTCIISEEDGSVFTYADVGEVVRRIMGRLAAEGVRKGDALCMYSPAHAESFLLFWAAANLGAVFVPLDFHMPEKQLARVLEQVKPKILFSDRASSSRCPVIKEIGKTILFDEAEAGCYREAQTFSPWLDSSGSEAVAPAIVPEDTAVILYTSGSTGDPKGVVLSHGALCRCSGLVTKLFHWTADDIVLSLGELHAIGGIRAAIAALHAGYSFLVTARAQRSNVLYLAECIRKYRCTQLTTGPIILRLLLQHRDRVPAGELGSLKFVMSAGSNLSPRLANDFYEHFHVPVLNCYGLTETAGACIGYAPEDAPSASECIGRPIGDCIAEIVDEGGAILADGATGELRIGSRNLMTGYFRDAKLTDSIMRNGWFYTGDLAMKRADGYIVLKGRLKNIIKQANGDLVSLEEVEQALEKHPGVFEAAVAGFTSERGDERLAAFIVPSAGPAHAAGLLKELRRYLKEELGPLKIPAEFILKAALPRGGTGKVLREELKREIVESGLAFGEGALA